MRTSLLLIGGLLMSIIGLASSPSTPAEATNTVQPATAEYVEVVARATSAFDAAGLELPAVEIVFSEDERECYGHYGVFQPARDPWRISICSELPFVLVHELAHAWIKANVDEATTKAYIELRNKPTWNSPQHDWRERGVEDAAFIIQQNLMVRPRCDLTDEWERRVTAFEFLVGAPSPLRDTSC